MVSFKNGMLVGLATVLLVNSVAFGDPSAWNRCRKEDWLSDVQAKGRVEWAKGCLLINDDQYDFLLRNKRYPTFIHANGSFKAPTTPGESCDGWPTGDDFLICKWGCYTGDQRVMFSSRYIPIAEAMQLETRVTALAEGSSLKDFRFLDQPIEAFISGQTSEKVLKFSTATGKTLQVTTNHPLVLSNGLVTEAAKVKVGDSLLGLVNEADLNLVRPEAIVAIESEEFVGTVYNLQPESTKELENIIIAEGLLNGSNRFQNEWSEREFRIRARLGHDVSDL